MTAFEGFPEGRTRYTPIPDLFFVELLGQISDLAELKLTLYMLWAIYRQKGYPRYLTIAELEAEGPLLSALVCGEDEDPLPVLHRAIDAAVGRGTLLHLCVGRDGEEIHYLFVNAPQGRKAIGEVKRGELVLERAGPVREPHIRRERPQILELYEQNIGLLPPLLAEELLEAEATYPAAWIHDAFQIAVQNNARRWRYVKSILERWAAEGKDDGTRPGAARKRYRR